MPRRNRGRLRPLTRADRVKRDERNYRRLRVGPPSGGPRSIHSPPLRAVRVRPEAAETAVLLGQRSVLGLVGRNLGRLRRAATRKGRASDAD